MKAVKHSILLIPVLLVVVAIALPLVSLAVVAPTLEVRYPDLLGVGQPSPTSLTQYVKYVFIFAYMAAGIIGVISIVIAGFQKMLYAGNAGKSKEANERIFNAILGIVILMTSFILLRTLNPSLLDRAIVASPPASGVYLVWPAAADDESAYFGYTWYKIGQSAFDTSWLNPSIKLLYYCPAITNGPTVLLWKYDGKNFHINSSQSTTVSLPCGTTNPMSVSAQTVTGSVKSFYWAYESAGVYWHMSEDCSGISSIFNAQRPGQAEDGDIPWFEDPSLNPTLDQTIRSARVINEPSANFNYGFILGADLHSNTNPPGPGGECSDPLILNNNPGSPFDANGCVAITAGGGPGVVATLDGDEFIAWSAHIIKQHKDPNRNNRNRGVAFHSRNKVYVAWQKGATNVAGTPSQNIGLMWKYNSSSLPATINFQDNLGNPVNLPNDGNLDNLIRYYGVQDNNNQRPVPPDECVEYRGDQPLYTNPAYLGGALVYDSTYPPPPVGRGYLSCLDKAQWYGDYEVVLYTHDETEQKRRCGIFRSGTDQIFIYDPERPGVPYSNIPFIFNDDQTVYQTIIIPTYSGY